MAQPTHSMSETATTTAADQVTPVRDLDTAARYFESKETAAPANDSTATAPAVAAGGDPENPDDPNTTEEPPPDPAKDKADEEPELTAEQKKELPEWAHRRMGEISAKKNELLEEVTTLKERETAKDGEIAELKQQLAGRAPTVVAPTPENPLANVDDPRVLQGELDQALNILDWCDQNPEGGTIELNGADGKPVTQEVSKEEMLAAKARANRMINQHVPQRMQFLQGRQEFVARAQEDYPDLLKPGTQDHSDYQALLSHWPELKRFLDPEIIAGRYLRGLKAELAAKAEKNGKGKPAAQPQKKPATVLAPSAPRQPAAAMPAGAPKNDAAKAEAKKQATKAGTPDAAARYFDAA